MAVRNRDRTSPGVQNHWCHLFLDTGSCQEHYSCHRIHECNHCWYLALSHLSTNRSAACCNEALKIATALNPNLDNYMMYFLVLLSLTLCVGTPETRQCIHTPLSMKRRKIAPSVEIFQLNGTSTPHGPCTISLSLSRKTPIRNPLPPAPTADIPSSQLKKPSLRSSSRSLYMQSIPQLEESTRPNLLLSLRSLLSDGEQVVVTDTKLPFELKFIIHFSA
jgi:NEDD8-activating enzyme E1